MAKLVVLVWGGAGDRPPDLMVSIIWGLLEFCLSRFLALPENAPLEALPPLPVIGGRASQSAFQAERPERVSALIAQLSSDYDAAERHPERVTRVANSVTVQ